MIYYRALQRSRDLSIDAVRLLSATSLAAYPAGALLLALIAFAPLIGSSVQRIVGEDAKVLDEYELRLRGRALSVCYAAFTALALLLVAYAAIASDRGLWLPASYDQFSAVFWGIFLYASVLPTALLSWMVERSFTCCSQ